MSGAPDEPLVMGLRAEDEAPPSPPPDLRLRGRPPQVMRLSRRTLAIAAGLGGTALAAVLAFALSPPSLDDKAPELISTDNRPTAEALAGAPKDYAGVPRLGPPLPGDLGRPILSAQQRGADVPAPPMGAPGQATAPSPAANAAETARQRLRAEREAARTAKLFVSGGDGQGAAPQPPAPGDPAGLGTGGPASAPSPAVPTPGNQAAKRAFLESSGDRRTVSAGRLVPPASRRLLQAGSVIPAALVTGIRSDLPGQVVAQVTEPVRDSLTGRLVLIPQGARLIGSYDSEVAFGQSRMLLAWDRLVLPDGRSIALERQPATDAAGRSGLADGVDRHWGAMLRAALVTTLLGVGAELPTSGDGGLARALTRGTQDSIGQVGRQLVGRQLDVQPTLTIRPGMPVRVLVTRDLVLD